MLRGLYASAIGMITQMNRLDVVSNNIANVNTTGYKKDTAITQPFSEELMKRLNDTTPSLTSITKGVSSVGAYNQGVFVNNINTDFSNGSLKGTDSALDLAISGDGFFAIHTMDASGEIQERYTRDGAFTLSNSRTLVTKDGYQVIGLNGSIVVPDGNITISPDGEVYANGEYVDTLKLVDFEDKTMLRKQEASLYLALEEADIKETSAKVEQGFIETSNVNSVKEMVEMIEISRAYEANQKIVTIYDASLGKAVSEIASK